MSTSNLQRLTSEKLSVFFGGYTIRENMRPEWMPTDNGGRLELDFYIEELSCAIEVQGIQHYEYNEFFHGDYESFQAQQERDESKRRICKSHGIELYEVFDEESLRSAIDSIKKYDSKYAENFSVDVPDYPKLKTKFTKRENKVRRVLTKNKEQLRTTIDNYIRRPSEARMMAIKKLSQVILREHDSDVLDDFEDYQKIVINEFI